MQTFAYLLKRVALAVLTVWVVITVTFFVMRAVPGGPFLGEKALTQEVMDALQAKYGLDKPLLQQYTTYLKDVLKFDFGPSIKQRGRTVTDIIKSVAECADLTNQRVSALVRQLMPTYIERVEEKKKAYFVKVA